MITELVLIYLLPMYLVKILFIKIINILKNIKINLGKNKSLKL